MIPEEKSTSYIILSLLGLFFATTKVLFRILTAYLNLLLV